jgi:uncharacterized protein YecT (DUF1311 family)
VAVSAQAQPSNIRYWRITGMIPEPLTDAAALPASARALVQSGVAFLEHEVKGPPPLACKEPVYGGDHPVSVGELFGGRVPEDGLKEAAERLGIGEVAAHSDAFEVACGSKITNYFWFDGVDRLVRVGDAIYRMHPSDGDHAVDLDAWVQRPTPGFDCDKAQTTAEKLICTDAEIATAYRTIADRYAALRTQETPESFAMVRAAQRAWLNYTPASCGADREIPEDQSDRRNTLECLREAYKDWSDAFAGLSIEHAGRLRIEPRIHVFAELDPRHKIDWIVYPWLIGTPETTAAAFNKTIGETLAPQTTLLTRKQVTEPNADYPISAWRRYGVSRFDDRLVSLSVWGQIYGGGAHEGLIDQTINFDVRRARRVGPTDFFRAGTGWETAISAYCREQLTEEGGEKPALARVRAVVTRDDAWLFGPEKATVHFAVYTVGSFAAGPRQVDIPYRVLRRFLRDDAPLPIGAGR